MGILLQILILLWARSADFLGVIWTAQAPPKRQVVGSNPSGPDSIMTITQHDSESIKSKYISYISITNFF